MLKLSRKGSAITVETMGGILSLDSQRGGQITNLTVKNELEAHPLLKKGGLLPDLQFRMNGKPVSLADSRAKMTVTMIEPDFVRIAAKNVLQQGALILTLEYEIHEEGLLFCNMFSEIPAGAKIDLKAASFNLALDLRKSQKARWGYYMRDYTFKRDYSSIHALAKFKAFQELDEGIKTTELLPMVSLDLGWGSTRFYANRMEFYLEDWTAFHDQPLTRTRTSVGIEEGLWQIRWHLYEGPTVKLRGTSHYRNRWGLAFGRARSQSGADADVAVRNNLLGCKICHCKYPYARAGNRWPWVSMPIKQVAEQTSQLFIGNPEVSRVDEAADLGANLMILHQFWMRNPGSNGEPVADFQPEDPKWLRAFTNRCHKRNMRMAYYVRGTEQWFLFSTFFEDFLKKNWDGYYADWNFPFSMGFVKCSPMHTSLYSYFHFTKAMRQRVGPGGIMVGHAGNATMISQGSFDALLGGENSVRHDELLTNPESSAYFALLDCSGAHFIGGNLGDRIAFASPKAAAMCAALGMTSQVNMEPGQPFSIPVEFIKPLWDAMGRLPGKIVRLHNPAYIPTRAVSTGAKDLFPSLWQSNRHKALLLVTNMGTEARSGTVDLNLSELDVPKKAKVKVLPIAGTFQDATVDGHHVRLKNIPALKYTALMIG